MSAVQEAESHHGIADVEQSLIDRVVGGRAGESLHVVVDLVSRVTIGRKGFGCTTARQRFDRIRVLYSFVVARVTIAAIMSKSRRIVKNLFFGHPTRLFVGVAFRIDILE